MSEKTTITIFPHARLSEYGSISREVFFEKICEISGRNGSQKIVMIGSSGLIDNCDLMDTMHHCCSEKNKLSIIFQDEPWMAYDSKYVKDRLAKILSFRSFASKVSSVTDPSRGAQIIDQNERTTAILCKAFPDITFENLADLNPNLAYSIQENGTPGENKREVYRKLHNTMCADFYILLDSVLTSGVENIIIMFDTAFSHAKFCDYKTFYKNYESYLLKKAIEYPKVKFLQLQSHYGNTTNETRVFRHDIPNLISSLIPSRSAAGSKYVPSFTSINV